MWAHQDTVAKERPIHVNVKLLPQVVDRALDVDVKLWDRLVQHGVRRAKGNVGHAPPGVSFHQRKADDWCLEHVPLVAPVDETLSELAALRCVSGTAIKA